MKTRVTELLGIRYPIVQGGLAYLAYAELAAAVSNAGGLGQITAMTVGGPEALREEIRKVRQLTDKPFGVNFAIGQHGRPYEDLLAVAIEERVPVISVTGGNLTPLVEKIKPHGIKVLVLVSSVRQAKKCEEIGVDAVMAVGQEGGGHIGATTWGRWCSSPAWSTRCPFPFSPAAESATGEGWWRRWPSKPRLIF